MTGCGPALFSGHTNPAFLDSWTFHLLHGHGQPFCLLCLSLHICKMGESQGCDGCRQNCVS